MAREITVICDDDVEVISITTKSKKAEGDSWVIGIFEVKETSQVRMPEILDENKIDLSI